MKRRELERIRRLEEEAVMKVHCQKEIRYRFEREQQKSKEFKCRYKRQIFVYTIAWKMLKTRLGYQFLRWLDRIFK